MIDAHVSFQEPYSYELLCSYVEEAQKKGISELTILEPTHKFIECERLYTEIKYTYPYQEKWYEAIPKVSIQEYQDFIEDMKGHKFPISIRYGICVCYFTQHEWFIRQMKKAYPYDCFVGSIQFIDNIAFAWEDHSYEMLWDKYNANFLYRRYYEMMNAMITSKIFDGVHGFDDIKLLGVKPTFKMEHTYHKLAMLLALHHMYVENDHSIGYGRNHPDQGLSEEFIAMCQKLHVEIRDASNARCAKDVGRGI